MLVQKTFHMHVAPEVAKEKLSGLAEYYRSCTNFDRFAVDPEGFAHLEFRIACGFRGSVDLIEVPTKNPSQTMFRSRNGNMEIMGVLEYFQIKPELTEVVLTVDYTIVSPIFQVLDYLFGGVDRFLNRQLQRVEMYFNQPVSGIRADTNLRHPINGRTVGERLGEA